MKRLYILAGLATLALATPTQAADCPNWDKECIAKQGAPSSNWAPPGCGYGGSNDPKCKQNPDGSWPGQPQGGWPGQPPPQGGWPQQGGTQQPPPGQAQPWPQQPPPGQTTQQRCPPGQVLLRYGNRWRCVRQGGTQEQTGNNCQPGWIYSRRLYRCVPGTVGQGPGQDQGTPGRRVCGYGKVWSDRLYRCVPFRTGGGTDGGNQGGNQGGSAAAPASAGPKAAIAAFPVAVAVAASIST